MRYFSNYSDIPQPLQSVFGFLMGRYLGYLKMGGSIKFHYKYNLIS